MRCGDEIVVNEMLFHGDKLRKATCYDLNINLERGMWLGIHKVGGDDLTNKKYGVSFKQWLERLGGMETQDEDIKNDFYYDWIIIVHC